jgi:hypothetical protein
LTHIKQILSRSSAATIKEGTKLKKARAPSYEQACHLVGTKTMSNHARKLIRIIVGRVEAGTSLKECLHKVSRLTGIDYRSLQRAWQASDGYLSKQTKEALQDTVRRIVDYDDAEIVRRIEAHIHQLETVDPEMYGPDIDAARDFVARYKSYSTSRVSIAVPCGVLPDSEE